MSTGVSLGPPLGVLGGTFDPVHHGHLRVAIELREQLALERVHLVPARTPVHRAAPVASAEDRLAMLRCAVEEAPELVADDRELRREGPSYMVETLRDFRAEFPERPLCLLLGMDAFSALDTWYRWTEILDLAHVAIAERPGASMPSEGAVGALVRERFTERANALPRACHGRVVIGRVPRLDISSSGIRDALADERSARYLLPAGVIDYIEREGLYSDAK